MADEIFINIKVATNKKQNRILKYEGENSYRVELKAKPIEGRANKELIKYLAEVLGKRQDQITIIKGLHSHEKVLRIEVTEKKNFFEKIKEFNLRK